MLLAVRGEKGIHMASGPPDYKISDEIFTPDTAKNCKVRTTEEPDLINVFEMPRFVCERVENLKLYLKKLICISVYTKVS
jgi:hypothetical protein